MDGSIDCEFAINFNNADLSDVNCTDHKEEVHFISSDNDSENRQFFTTWR